MRRRSFKKWFEAVDIFGFERDVRHEHPDDSLLTKPIEQFDVEEMMNLLKKKSIGVTEAEIVFPNVIQWGSLPGSVKLEVSPKYHFSIKKLGTDKEGNSRWVTSKLFQLNRNGLRGYEDSVAQEVFEQLKMTAMSMIESPQEDYKGLESLVNNIYSKLKRTANPVFIPESVKKLHEDYFIINFGVRGHGLEAKDQQRVEQNQTHVVFDRSQGIIRIFNQNLLSNTGGPHSWKISGPSLDCYFFPTQNRDDISEVVATFMRYY